MGWATFWGIYSQNHFVTLVLDILYHGMVRVKDLGQAPEENQ
jgi:hypothetical protein